jgi:hypothetical protein
MACSAPQGTSQSVPGCSSGCTEYCSWCMQDRPPLGFNRHVGGCAKCKMRSAGVSVLVLSAKAHCLRWFHSDTASFLAWSRGPVMRHTVPWESSHLTRLRLAVCCPHLDCGGCTLHPHSPKPHPDYDLWGSLQSSASGICSLTGDHP